MLRTTVRTAAAVLLALTAVSARAQNNAGPEDVVLTAGDGWPVHVTYYESTAGKESPVIVMLPSAEGLDNRKTRTRRTYDQLAKSLNQSGFAVVTVDLRKHGDSLPTDLPAAQADRLKRLVPTDYTAMAALDLEAVKAFILQKHHEEKLNIRKGGIVACGSSAAVGLGFAAADWLKKPYDDAPSFQARTPRGQDVLAAFLISPEWTVKGLNVVQVNRTLKEVPVAIQILATSRDRGEKADAEKYFRALELKQEEFRDARKIILDDEAVSAEGFLQSANVRNAIKDFFTKSLKELDAPWRPRISRLQ